MNGFKALNWKKCYLIGHLTKKKSEREITKRTFRWFTFKLHCCINCQILPVEDI